jgi:hypothetical protein
MRKQNFAMKTTSAIPLFGYTEKAREFEVEYKGMEQTILTTCLLLSGQMQMEPWARITSVVGRTMESFNSMCTRQQSRCIGKWMKASDWRRHTWFGRKTKRVQCEGVVIIPKLRPTPELTSVFFFLLDSS